MSKLKSAVFNSDGEWLHADTMQTNRKKLNYIYYYTVKTLYQKSSGIATGFVIFSKNNINAGPVPSAVRFFNG